MAASDIQQLETLKLRKMADELKADAKALWAAGYKTEAVTLIRLFRRLVTELHRRMAPDNFYRWN